MEIEVLGRNKKGEKEKVKRVLIRMWFLALNIMENFCKISVMYIVFSNQEVLIDILMGGNGIRYIFVG